MNQFTQVSLNGADWTINKQSSCSLFGAGRQANACTGQGQDGGPGAHSKWDRGGVEVGIKLLREGQCQWHISNSLPGSLGHRVSLSPSQGPGPCTGAAQGKTQKTFPPRTSAEFLAETAYFENARLPLPFPPLPTLHLHFLRCREMEPCI